MPPTVTVCFSLHSPADRRSASVCVETTPARRSALRYPSSGWPGEVDADQFLLVRQLLHRRIFGQVGIVDAEQLVRPADGVEQPHLAGDDAVVHTGDRLHRALGGGRHPGCGDARSRPSRRS